METEITRIVNFIREYMQEDLNTTHNNTRQTINSVWRPKPRHTQTKNIEYWWKESGTGKDHCLSKWKDYTFLYEFW